MKVLKYLKEQFPTEGWKAERQGFGWNYSNIRGDQVYWVSAIASRYDGDDNTFQSQLYLYPRSGRPKLLLTGRTYST
jgi:hypothetical protein